MPRMLFSRPLSARQSTAVMLLLSAQAALAGACSSMGPAPEEDVAAVDAPLVGNPPVLTQHNDNGRSGANLSETVLTTANVNASLFGKLFEHPVDGDVFAQPLYAPGITMADGRVHNVVYAATMHNTVYAFDADTNTELWQMPFGRPVPIGDVQHYDIGIRNEVGILSTPVIDLSSSSLLVLVRQKDADGSYHQRLHKLDLTRALDRIPGGVDIAFPAVGSTAGTAFARTQNQRAALLLAGGVVYIAWAAHDDEGPYHGWIMGYDASTLARVSIFDTTPSGSQGGIWQAGGGLAADAQNNIYAITGNGTFGNESGQSAYGMTSPANLGDSILKLSTAGGSLTFASFFTPYNQSQLNAYDLDLGSAGAMVLPGTSYVVGGGKEGKIYLLNSASLGGYQAAVGGVNPGAVDELQASPACVDPTNWITCFHIHGSPVYWNDPAHGPTIYVWAEKDYLKAFSLSGSRFDRTPRQSTMKAPVNAQGRGMPGGFLSISANGSQAGTGVVWATHPYSATGGEVDTENNVVTGILRAFDASDPSRELWNSQQNAARDDLGSFAKGAAPTVANGKVFLSTFSNKVVVYGLLPQGTSATYGWNFDEGSGTTTADTSGHGRTGTLAGGAGWTTGVNASAVSLDGASGHVDIDQAVVDTSLSFTAAAWVKFDNTNGWQTILSQDGGSISGFYLQKDATTGKLAMAMLSADSTDPNVGRKTTAQSVVTPQPGVWYHVVGVNDRSAGVLRLYVNGTLQSVVPFGGGFSATGRTEIGRAKWAGNPVDFVAGAIDDARMYGRALTGADIRALYARVGGAFWAFDEGTGSFASDSTGNYNTGTLNGGAGWTAGVSGGALALNGSTSYVDVLRPLVSTTHSYSAAAWVKLDTTNGWQTILSQDGASISGFYLQRDASTGKFAFAALSADSTSAAKASAQSTITPVAGVWYHVAGVYDQSAARLKLYVDGVLQSSIAFGGGFEAGGRTVVGRAKWAGSPVDFVAGAIDEAHVYRRAISDADVQALYAQTAGAAFLFDEGSGFSTTDWLGNGPAATLAGGATWAAGVNASGLHFDGAGGFVDASRAVVDTTRSFTAAAWVKLDSLDGYRTMVSQDGSSISGFYLQKDGTTGKFAMAMLAADSTGATKATAQSAITPVTGVWYHVAGVYDQPAARLKLYVNGALQSSVAFGGGFRATGNTQVGRAKWGGSAVDFVPGTIDGARVYPRALADAEVQSLWASHL